MTTVWQDLTSDGSEFQVWASVHLEGHGPKYGTWSRPRPVLTSFEFFCLASGPLPSIHVQNLKFVSSAVPEIVGGAKIWNLGHVQQRASDDRRGRTGTAGVRIAAHNGPGPLTVCPISGASGSDAESYNCAIVTESDTQLQSVVVSSESRRQSSHRFTVFLSSPYLSSYISQRWACRHSVVLNVNEPQTHRTLSCGFSQ